MAGGLPSSIRLWGGPHDGLVVRYEGGVIVNVMRLGAPALEARYLVYVVNGNTLEGRFIRET